MMVTIALRDLHFVIGLGHLGDADWATPSGRRKVGDRTTGRQDNWATGQLGNGTTGRLVISI